MKGVKRLIKPAGAILGIAAMGFFVQQAASQPFDEFARLSGVRIAAAIPIGIFLYLLCYVPGLLIWKRVLAMFRVELSMRALAPISMVSQFGKYVPGNVAQYVGRHGLLRALGASHGALAGAAVFEVLSALLGGGLAAIAGLLFLGGNGAGTVALKSLAAVGLLVAGISCFFLFLRSSLVAHWAFTQPLREAVFEPGSIARCIAMHFGMYVFLGFTQWTVAAILIGSTAIDFPVIVMAVAIGSLAGFMTPGAPAGLGIREALLLAFMAPSMGSAMAVAAIALYRVCTLGGDFAAFFVGLYMKRHTVRSVEST